jgi:hypothetical protein
MVRVRAKWDLTIPETDGHWRQVLKGRVIEVTTERADELLAHGWAEIADPSNEKVTRSP